MEENKYYVPEINEFHVGFEYEQKNPDGWEKYIYGEINPAQGWMLPFNEDGEFISDLVRVPYLSKEDIEAEGFTESLPFKDKFFSETKEYMVQPYYNVRQDKRETLVRIFKCWNTEPHIPSEEIFRGSIKNKSEFKRILKVIGV